MKIERYQEKNFDSVSSDTILDGILQALGFYFSLLDYFEEGTPWFINITDTPNFTIESVDNDQPIIDFEDEKVKKQKNT